jgi:hypothetical protein
VTRYYDSLNSFLINLVVLKCSNVSIFTQTKKRSDSDLRNTVTYAKATDSYVVFMTRSYSLNFDLRITFLLLRGVRNWNGTTSGAGRMHDLLPS